MAKFVWKLGLTVWLILFGGAHLSAPLLAQQRKVKPVGRVVVVDSRGQIIGTVQGGTSLVDSGPAPVLRPTVLLQINGQVYPVKVGRDGFYAGLVLYFEGYGCTGAAWYATDDGPPPIVARTVIGPPGETLYAEDLGAAPETMVRKSVFRNGQECVDLTPSEFQAVPVRPVVDLLTVFTPPFTLKADGDNGTGNGNANGNNK